MLPRPRTGAGCRKPDTEEVGSGEVSENSPLPPGIEVNFG
jgi:hypothetical protein